MNTDRFSDFFTHILVDGQVIPVDGSCGYFGRGVHRPGVSTNVGEPLGYIAVMGKIQVSIPGDSVIAKAIRWLYIEATLDQVAWACCRQPWSTFDVEHGYLDLIYNGIIDENGLAINPSKPVRWDSIRRPYLFAKRFRDVVPTGDDYDFTEPDPSPTDG